MPRIALVPGLRAGGTAAWLLQMGQLTRILAYETGRNCVQSLIKDNAYYCLLFTCTRIATVCPAELWSFVPCCRISPRSGACTGCHEENWVSVFSRLGLVLPKVYRYCHHRPMGRKSGLIGNRSCQATVRHQWCACA
jgi:hypothetical protein